MDAITCRLAKRGMSLGKQMLRVLNTQPTVAFAPLLFDALIEIQNC